MSNWFSATSGAQKYRVPYRFLRTEFWQSLSSQYQFSFKLILCSLSTQISIFWGFKSRNTILYSLRYSITDNNLTIIAFINLTLQVSSFICLVIKSRSGVYMSRPVSRMKQQWLLSNQLSTTLTMLGWVILGSSFHLIRSLSLTHFASFQMFFHFTVNNWYSYFVYLSYTRYVSFRSLVKSFKIRYFSSESSYFYSS